MTVHQLPVAVTEAANAFEFLRLHFGPSYQLAAGWALHGHPFQMLSFDHPKPVAFIIHGIGTMVYGQRDYWPDGSYITSEWFVLAWVARIASRRVDAVRRFADCVRIAVPAFGVFWAAAEPVRRHKPPEVTGIISLIRVIQPRRCIPRVRDEIRRGRMRRDEAWGWRR